MGQCCGKQQHVVAPPEPQTSYQITEPVRISAAEFPQAPLPGYTPQASPEASGAASPRELCPGALNLPSSDSDSKEDAPKEKTAEDVKMPSAETASEEVPASPRVELPRPEFMHVFDGCVLVNIFSFMSEAELRVMMQTSADVFTFLLEPNHELLKLPKLHVLADCGHDRIAERLILQQPEEEREDFVDAIDRKRKHVSAIHIACQNGRLDFVKMLLKFGANVDKQCVFRTVPLHRAIVFEGDQDVSHEICKLLLAKQADLSKRTRNDVLEDGVRIMGSETPLHVAVRYHREDLAVMFLDHGAELAIYNNKMEGPLAVGITAKVPESLGQLLVDRANGDSITWTTGSLDWEKVFAERRVYYCRYFFTKRILGAPSAVVSKLLDEKIKQQAIHICAVECNVPLIEFILDKGGAIDPVDSSRCKVDPRDVNLRTPLMCCLAGPAAAEDKIRMCYFLLGKNADVGAKDIKDTSLLHIACKIGPLELVQWVLAQFKSLPDVDEGQKKGKNRSEEFDGDDMSPLAIAAYHSHYDICKYLVEEEGVTLKEQPELPTVLHFASQAVNGEKIVSFLLKKGCDILAEDWQGKQAIHFAAECGRFESMKILITANADPSAILDFGMSALLYAAGNSQAECIAYLIEHGKDQEACSPNYCSMGQTALHKVCMSEIPTDAAIKVLLDANADVNLKEDSAERTPLHMLCDSRHGQRPDLVRMLIDANADIACKDTCGWSGLHLAARQGHDEICKIFVKAGLKDTRDRDGFYAGELASKRGHHALGPFPKEPEPEKEEKIEGVATPVAVEGN